MRNEETFGDQTYVVNLTRQLVGERTVSALTKSGKATPTALYVYLGGHIRAKLKNMTNEKVGMIGCYGHNKDLSEPLAGTCGFIRKTGIEEVWPHGYSNDCSGREIIEEVAVRTIISVLCDIIRQGDYIRQRDQEEDNEEQYDRAMSDYIHYGPAKRTP